MIQHPIEFYYDIALSRIFLYRTQALDTSFGCDDAFTKGKIKVL